jgi:hypothetical protein
MNFESQPEHSGNSFLRKKFKELPVFFPPDYKNSNAVGIVVSHSLTHSLTQPPSLSLSLSHTHTPLLD